MRWIALITVLILAPGCLNDQEPEPAPPSLQTPPKATITPTSLPFTTTTWPSTTSSSTASSLPVPLAPSTTILNQQIRTFTDSGGKVCTLDGKPVVRMYSKSACHNCEFSDQLFDEVVSEYTGRIVAHHWMFDSRDDKLTPEIEGSIPQTEYDLFFEGNEHGTLPYFNFGCRYTRIGNGYQVRDLPEKEKAEMRAVIEQLL